MEVTPNLDPLMADGFSSLRRPKRRRNENEYRIAKDALYYFTKDDDLDELYERHLVQQTQLQGSGYCYSIKRTYGNGPEVIASLRINAPLLPTIIIRRVPAQADELAVIAEEVGLVYKGGSLATFGDAQRQHHKCALCDDTDGPLEFDHVIPVSIGGSNDLDSMQALCISDHRLKSEQERHTHTAKRGAVG